MTVYCDTLFGLNFLINYLLLLGSARLGGERIRRWRLLLAAGIGAGYAVAALVPALGFLSTPGMKLLTAGVMILCAFGCDRRTPKQVLLFFGLSFAFCGLVIAANAACGGGLHVRNGLAFYPVSLQALAAGAAAGYCICSAVFSRLGEHTGGEILDAALELDGRTVRLPVLRDTGNSLRDPVSNRRVLVADWELARELLPADCAPLVTRDSLQNPAALLTALSARWPQARLRLIPYRAVGVPAGLLLTVRCDALKIGKTETKNALVAFSPTAVSDGGGYRALAGGV